MSAYPPQRWFKRAAEAKARLAAMPPPVPRPPVHTGNVVCVLENGTTRMMSAGGARHALGVAKGGQISATRPNSGRFTSATGRKTVQKAWNTRWRKVRGVRIGRSYHRAPAVARAPLRARHTLTPSTDSASVWFGPDAQWYAAGLPLSERAALKRLGYLRRDRAPLPVVVTPVEGRRKKSDSVRNTRKPQESA